MDAVDRSKAILEASHDTIVPALELGKGSYSERFLKAIDHAIQFKQADRPKNIDEWRQEFEAWDDLETFKTQNQLENQLTQPGTRVITVKDNTIPRSALALVATLALLIVAGLTYLIYSGEQDQKDTAIVLETEDPPVSPPVEVPVQKDNIAIQGAEDPPDVTRAETPVARIEPSIELPNDPVEVEKAAPIEPVPTERQISLSVNPETPLASSPAMEPANTSPLIPDQAGLNQEQLINVLIQAESNLDRALELYQNNMISQQEFDEIQTAYFQIQQSVINNYPQFPDEFGDNSMDFGNNGFGNDISDSLFLDVEGYGSTGYLSGEVEVDLDTGDVDGSLYDSNGNDIYFEGAISADGRIRGYDENGNIIELEAN